MTQSIVMVFFATVQLHSYKTNFEKKKSFSFLLFEKTEQAKCGRWIISYK